MKIRYLIQAVVLLFFAVFTTSCENEDVIITAPGVIHVNTLSVVNAFPYEMKKGELAELSLQYKLNTTLFIFDDNDKFIKRYDDYSDAYIDDVTIDLVLDPGKYSVVALSRVVMTSGNKYVSMFWEYSVPTSNTNRNTIEIKYLDTYYNSQKAILGVGSSKIEISNNKYEYNLDLKPAGTLLCYRWINPRALGTTNEYRLTSNKKNDTMKIVNLDNYEYEYIEAGTNKVFSLTNVKSSDISTTALTFYGYVFMLPMNDVAFSFNYTNSTLNYLPPLTDDMVIDCKPGYEYDIWINLQDSKHYNEITYGIENKTSESSRSDAVDADTYAAQCNDAAIPLSKLVEMVYPNL